jgi:Fe-S-cluster containining protein
MTENSNTSRQQFHSEVDKIFFTDGYNLATEFLKEGINSKNLLAMSESIYDSMDQLIEAFTQRCLKENKTIDCKKGCYLCCCQAVLVLPYEILYLQRFIRENLSKKDNTLIFRRAKEKYETTAKMKAQEFLHLKSPCPLLENGSCLAYEARPLACRTYISSRVDGCVEEYHNPKDVDIYPDLYDFTIRAGRMINEGICNYLFENNISSPEWQIESGLQTTFEDRKAIDKWLSGENIFQTRNFTIDELTYIDNFGRNKGSS